MIFLNINIRPYHSLFSGFASHLDAFSDYQRARGYWACFVKQPIDYWRRQSFPLVLQLTSLQTNTHHVDKNQPVSRRFELSSRNTLTSEPLDPWIVLPIQDVLSQHRSNKQYA